MYMSRYLQVRQTHIDIVQYQEFELVLWGPDLGDGGM